jgi:hypothetical protein
MPKHKKRGNANKPNWFFSLLNRLYGVAILSNFARVIYSFIFLSLITFAIIGLKENAIIGYSDLLIIAFLSLLALYIVDILVSNSMGIYFILNLIQLIFFMMYWIYGYFYLLSLVVINIQVTLVITVILAVGEFILLSTEKYKNYSLKRKITKARR